jgi:hypothetical protein
VTASISPCSWLYPSYGLQLHFKLPTDNASPNGGEFVVLKKPWADCTSADIDLMVTQMRAKLEDGGLLACPTCGKLTWNRAIFRNKFRNQNCETCFMVTLKSDFAAIVLKENKRIARMDAKRKKEGFTHRVDAWIHPSTGDDEQISWYTRQVPTDAATRAFLVSKGSRVVNDYTVLEL